MPARAEIRFKRFDGTLPVFEIDLGDSRAYRVDLATAHSLLEPANAGARTARNYSGGAWVTVAAGVVEMTVPAVIWNTLDRGGGRVFYRVTTRDTTGALLRSVQFGQSQTAPWIGTTAPAVTAADPRRGPSGGGTAVRLTGSGFTAATAVRFGNPTATFQVTSDTEITTVSPVASPAGPVVIVVETPFGVSAGNAVFEYEANALPEIVSPVPGSTLATRDVTFTWTPNSAAVEEWWLRVEHGDAGVEMHEPLASSVQDTSGTVTDLPLDGRGVRVALYYRIAGTWAVTPFNYVMAADPAFVQAKNAARPRFEQHIVPINDDDIRFPNDDDILILFYGERAVVLPASWNMVTALVAGGPPIEPIGVAAIPTIAKEGFYLVSVGGRLAYAMDVGGARKVVFPHALGAAMEALGVQRVDGVIVKHIDADHVRQFRAFVRNFRIAPANIHFHDVFIAGPASTPGSTFQRQFREIERDHPNQRFGILRTPPAGSNAFFRHLLYRGDISVDLVGHTDAFNQLGALRRAGVSQSMNGLRDAAIPMVRLRHQPSGQVMLDVTDLRGRDIVRYAEAMGTDRFSRLLRGVEIINGFQHHMGALGPLSAHENVEDRMGLIRLLRETLLRNGNLDVVVQSRSPQGGANPTGFVLNMSLVRVLNHLGVDVHLALNASATSAGALVWMDDGRIVHRGGGRLETHRGDRATRESARRLADLRVLATLETTYSAELHPQLRAKVQGASAAHNTLKDAWDRLFRIGFDNVHTSTEARRNPDVINAAQVRTALSAVHQVAPMFAALTLVERMEARETHDFLETRASFRAEMARVRQTGTLSVAGLRGALRMLRQVNRDRAHQIINTGGLARHERERLRRMLERPVVRVRVGNAALLALMAAGELLRWLTMLRARWYRQYVKPGLEALSWWQNMGIQPGIKGLDDGVFGNVITTSPQRIKDLVEADDLDALAIISLPQDSGTVDEPGAWEILAVMLRSHVVNFLDYSHFIDESPAIRRDANGWSFMLSDIVPTLADFDVSTQWIHSDVLTRIVTALHEEVAARTTEDIRALRYASAPNPVASLQDPDYARRDTFEGKPRATRLARFKDSLGDGQRMLFAPDGTHQFYYHYDADSLFYVFPDSESPEPVPSGELVVGGATFASYSAIMRSPVLKSIYAADPQGNPQVIGVERRHNRHEVMFARESDLEILPLD